jgi:hypothetical protein
VLGVCLPHPTNGEWRNQWSYVLSHFGPEEVWVVGEPAGERPLWKGARAIAGCVDLPALPLVVVQPRRGRYLPGRESLVGFSHPEDAIYLFGADNANMSKEDIAREPDHLVYIPTSDDHEMWSWVAGAVVLYDRMVKRG